VQVQRRTWSVLLGTHTLKHLSSLNIQRTIPLAFNNTRQLCQLLQLTTFTCHMKADLLCQALQAAALLESCYAKLCACTTACLQDMYAMQTLLGTRISGNARDVRNSVAYRQAVARQSRTETEYINCWRAWNAHPRLWHHLLASIAHPVRPLRTTYGRQLILAHGKTHMHANS
jgi:hypothetical protein